MTRIALHGGENDFGRATVKTLRKIPDFEAAQVAGDPVATYYIMPFTGRRLDN